MPVDQDNLVRVILKDRPRLVAYIWSIVHDEHVADDLYQEVSVVALQKREEIQDEVHLLRWLRRVARDKAMDHLRRCKLEPVALSDRVMELLESDWEAYERNSGSPHADALRQCLKKLTPYAQQIVALRYREGLSGEKLAQRMNRRVHTIYVALTRIHNALFNCIRAERNEVTGRE